MFHVIAGAFLVAGTLLQAYTSLHDLRRTHRDAVELWEAEEELTRRERWWRRRRTRRALVRQRDPEMHRRLVHVDRVLTGWLLMVLGAVCTLVASLV